MTSYTAKLKFLHMAPRKVRAVSDLLKKLTVSEAEAQLMLQSRRAARPILKLLRSAAANARAQNKTLEADRLVIGELRVDQGPMLKRFLPRAMGRATPLQKKMSHVTLTLTETPTAKKSRFIIQPPQKKLRTAPKKKTPKIKPEPKVERPKEKSGFLKRVFRRKAI